MSHLAPLLLLLTQEKDEEYRLFGTRNYLLSSSDAPFFYENSSSSPQSVIAEADQINDGWRLKIAEWCYEVVDHFNLGRETASIALNYVDRFMVFLSKSDRAKVTRRAYKLLTLTSTYVAIKIHGMAHEPTEYALKPSIRVFVELARGKFSIEEIELMELKLLHTLRWRLNPPLPVNFVESLLTLLPEWQVGAASCNRGCLLAKSAIYEMSRYFSEVAMCVSNFSFLFKPSTTGCAAILRAIDTLKEDPSMVDIMPPKHIISSFLDLIFSQTSLGGDIAEIEEAKYTLKQVCPQTYVHTDSACPQPPAVVNDAHGGRGHERSTRQEPNASPAGVVIHY